jgi:hypothetical protein
LRILRVLATFALVTDLNNDLILHSVLSTTLVSTLAWFSHPGTDVATEAVEKTM